MIPERHMKQARRLDNGELMTGYLTIMWKQPYIIDPNDENTAFPIDPATVEDIAVKPVTGENEIVCCPYCRSRIGVFRGRNYCPDCGQRIDWEV